MTNKFMSRRVFAFLLDWYAGAALSSMPVVFLWNKLTNEVEVNTNLTMFQSPYGYVAGLLAILFGAAYFYAVPQFVWKGQTLGKRLMKLQIVDEEGGPASAVQLFFRQVVGILILESAFLLPGDLLIQMITMAAGSFAGKAVSYLQLGLFAASAFLVWKKGFAIHDLFGQSKVIEYKN